MDYRKIMKITIGETGILALVSKATSSSGRLIIEVYMLMI